MTKTDFFLKFFFPILTIQSEVTAKPQIENLASKKTILRCSSQFRNWNAEIEVSLDHFQIRIQTLDKKNYTCVSSAKWRNQKTSQLALYTLETDYIKKCEPILPKPLDRSIRNKMNYQYDLGRKNSELTWIRYEKALPCKIGKSDFGEITR
jgi:hypothetical protein